MKNKTIKIWKLKKNICMNLMFEEIVLNDHDFSKLSKVKQSRFEKYFLTVIYHEYKFLDDKIYFLMANHIEKLIHY